MKRLMILLLCLAGCNTPTAAFYGASSKTVTVEGSTYSVYWADNRAQAIRTNVEARFRRGAEGKVVRAIQSATGCKVVGQLSGDPVVANASLSCKGRTSAPTQPPPKRPDSYVCDLDGSRAYCEAE